MGEGPLRAEAMDATKKALEPLRFKVHLVAHRVGVAKIFKLINKGYILKSTKVKHAKGVPVFSE